MRSVPGGRAENLLNLWLRPKLAVSNGETGRCEQGLIRTNPGAETSSP